MNAQSIVNKIDLLRAYLMENSPDVVVITESWTHDDVTDDFLKIKGYDLLGRCDPKDTLKG